VDSVNENRVFIVDDDPSVRRALSLFLISHDYQVESFRSSEEYLERESYDGTGCIILDVNMEGKSGLELQEELASLDSVLPIIFISGRGSIQMSVNTVKKGALNFLEKPFKNEDLLHSISEALALSQILKAKKDDVQNAQHLINALTSRELEIFKHLITGILNKQIAFELNITEHTVKLHRHSICEKLGVKSVPELLRIADKARIIPSK
jgi:FixJ family two-component response regulator